MFDLGRVVAYYVVLVVDAGVASLWPDLARSGVLLRYIFDLQCGATAEKAELGKMAGDERYDLWRKQGYICKPYSSEAGVLAAHEHYRPVLGLVGHMHPLCAARV